MSVLRIDHVSLCVSDLERLTRFYAVLGYESSEPYEAAGPDVEHGTGVVGARLRIAMLTREDGGLALELIQYLTCGRTGARHHAAVGASHLCFVVEDLPNAMEALVAAGAGRIGAPLTDRHGTTWVYLCDPDGNAIELIAG